MRPIRPGPVKNARIALPGSKSYTHRLMIAAALSNGPCRLENCLDSEDTRHTLSALSQMGAAVQENPDCLIIRGLDGRFLPTDTPIDLENSGTSMRLLAGVCSLGQGDYILTGTARMKERPIHHLLDALNQIGVQAESINGNGCPPIRIKGQKPSGSRVSIDCSISSQYLSALLLLAPLTETGLNIRVAGGPVSKPYIDMTVDVLNRFGITLERTGYEVFQIPGSQVYRHGDYTVPPDASQASYFWAAAAITGARITVEGLNRQSLQGDVRFVDVLEQMGCRINESPEGITVTGPESNELCPVSVSMGDMPDLVPTLAVAAAFAKGETVIQDVGHLRAKESDRLAAVRAELGKMGISAQIRDDSLVVSGGSPHGAEIETYNDHRMAMSFAIAGLRIPGMTIKNESCVAKSFPGFWEVFDQLYDNVL